MSSPLNASLLIAPFVDIVTGKIIESGTGMDPAKLVARANELIAINAALTQVNTGSGAAGLAALTAAIQGTSSLAPGEALALQSLLGAIAQQISLLTAVAGSTLLGQAATTVFDSILTTATAAAQAYVTKYGTPAAP